VVVLSEQDGVVRLEPRENIGFILRSLSELGDIPHVRGVVTELAELVVKRLDILVEQDVQRVHSGSSRPAPVRLGLVVFVVERHREVLDMEVGGVERFLGGDVFRGDGVVVLAPAGLLKLGEVLRIEVVEREGLVNGGLGQLEPVGDGRWRELALVD
jgi:hypothetical protein